MLKFTGLIFLLSIIFFPQNDKKKVLFFGDSITQAAVQNDGYIVQLQELLKSNNLHTNAELIGKGIGGNKVYDLYLRMQKDVIAHNPDIVFIYIGVNDVWHKQSHGTGTDPDKFVIFYQAIIDSLSAKGIDIVLCTPGVIGEKTDFSNPLDGDLNEYSNLIESLAKKNNLGLCDLRGKMLEYNKKHNKENINKGILTGDTVHLNKKGNSLVANAFFEILKNKLI